MDALEQIRRLGGAARFGDLDTSRYRLARLVDSGELLQAGRGCYAIPGTPAPLVAAALADAVVTCVSALHVRDPETPGRSDHPHLSINRHRGHRPAVGTGTRLHYEEGRRLAGTRLATVEQAAARAALCQPYDTVVAILDHLVHRHGSALLDPVLTVVRRSRPSRALALACDVDGRSRSPSETAVRLHLRRAGLAVAVAPDVPGVGEVDLIVEGVLVVELDGYRYHSDRATFRTDRRRDRRSLRLGLPTARFAYEDSDPARVLREIVPICRTLRTTRLQVTGTMPTSVAELLAEARSDWVGPAARAAGWRHLTGVDAVALHRTMPQPVVW